MTRLLLPLAVTTLAVAATVPRPNVDRFDEHAAWARLVAQVKLGPRPAGSPASRKLAARLKAALPRGSYQLVPGGLRNVVGFVRGRDPSRYVVVAAHYDTKDLPGFVGANDGAGGTAVLVQLARTIKPRTIGPSVVFLALDGEETPAGVPDQEFLQKGIRGAKVAAPVYKKAKAMILLDFVANKNLVIAARGVLGQGALGAPAPGGRPRRRRFRLPGRDERPDRGRPLPVQRGRRALDRPDRLRLPLLAQDVRRPLGRLDAEHRRGRRDDGRATALVLRRHGRMTNVKARASRSPLIVTVSTPASRFPADPGGAMP